jgi:hypothetical protein
MKCKDAKPGQVFALWLGIDDYGFLKSLSRQQVFIKLRHTHQREDRSIAHSVNVVNVANWCAAYLDPEAEVIAHFPDPATASRLFPPIFKPTTAS